ncbi:dual specificity phosphatase [Nitzschia inconspicua]|uniref:Dual specificity phosphatase n=1 Tax=Nitzschia inconspicua TaxID=303405 RepID=A0A9K3L7V9_9STRA|nr:dual specificity phosphatase [Nitzschia inconspicua]
MGTVHGVYLKYVGLSALSYAGYSMLSSENTSSASDGSTKTLLKTLSAVVLGYSTIVNGMIAILFKTERGMSIIGKNKTTGEIPMWSYLVFFPFHIPTLLYTHVHTRMGVYKSAESKDGKAKYNPVPVASEVQKGCAPTWDGVPLGPEDLEAAAVFAVEARKEGDVLIHCAHGRGRSTTVMCACLVKAGLYDNWKEAFEKGIKPFRSVCKLNKRMQEILTAWQEQFVDGKKAA